ncbi:MAG: hypothetical protein LBD37_07275 [Treponema sp.]|jgi:outer membrane protein assembly factor BamA|nr:hypothetical protein [Treponema sp.]
MIRRDGIRVFPLALCFWLITPLPSSGAQTSASAGEPKDERVAGVMVIGLTRTKARIAEQPLQKYVGLLISEVDLTEAQGRIVALGILEPVSLGFTEAAEGGVYLRVEVKEKWSLIPLPMVLYSSSGELSAGAMIMDANAFGINDKFVAGGLYKTNGWLALLMYDHRFREGAPGWNGFGMYSRDIRRDTDQREAVVRERALDALTIRGGAACRFFERYSAGLSLSYHDAALGEADPYSPEADARFISLGPMVSFRQTHWDGYLLSEQSASLRYAAQIDFAGSVFHSLSFTALYEKPLVPGFRLTGKAGLRYYPQAPFLFASAPPVEILPQTYRIGHYASGALGLEKYLFKISWGTLSVLASYQFAYSHSPAFANQIDHGVTGGIRFYLSKLAIPALGLAGAYNIAKNHGLFSFSLGMSF